ncbi:hypothetical protein GCM10017744_102750 [Streptomyces antimycoticus]|uniref:Uncharacterized protein n=1 Tax=Streptomyces antimycoticus TaxID=68175 RepID=A0A4D4KTX1_9ACTN|nr:hypothetical protein [Streptomyces antimycoticus]GDY49309.1 hypothetical protein SANT12839_101910 [Streptomyces antimycoticus]
MFTPLLIAAVLYSAGMAVSLWAISAPTDREEVHMGRKDSHTP